MLKNVEHLTQGGRIILRHVVKFGKFTICRFHGYDVSSLLIQKPTSNVIWYGVMDNGGPRDIFTLL